MGKVSARRLDAAFEGRSEHDDELGGAKVDEALDALARFAVLTTIADDRGDLVDEAGEITEAARRAIRGLLDPEGGHIEGGDVETFAREISARAARAKYPETPYELAFSVEIQIVTRPYNQWVRDVVATGSPVGG